MLHYYIFGDLLQTVPYLFHLYHFFKNIIYTYNLLHSLTYIFVICPLPLPNSNHQYYCNIVFVSVSNPHFDYTRYPSVALPEICLRPCAVPNSRERKPFVTDTKHTVQRREVRNIVHNNIIFAQTCIHDIKQAYNKLRLHRRPLAHRRLLLFLVVFCWACA